MKNLFILLLILSNCSFLLAQNDVEKKTVDTFIYNFNEGKFEEIYNNQFTIKMKKRMLEKYSYNFYEHVKTTSGKINTLQLLEYKVISSNVTYTRYHGTFENRNISVEFYIDKLGKITGMLMKSLNLL